MTARGKCRARQGTSPLVAMYTSRRGLKGRNITGITRFQRWIRSSITYQGDVPRFARHLPPAFIVRAFGARSYVRFAGFTSFAWSNWSTTRWNSFDITK